MTLVAQLQFKLLVLSFYKLIDMFTTQTISSYYNYVILIILNS